jgi:hypothetical protein
MFWWHSPKKRCVLETRVFAHWFANEQSGIGWSGGLAEELIWSAAVLLGRRWLMLSDPMDLNIHLRQASCMRCTRLLQSSLISGEREILGGHAVFLACSLSIFYSSTT